MSTYNGSRDQQFCILFYKYHPLTDDPVVLETYRNATEVLCTSLNLTGRILIGLSNDGEGINGTLAGTKDDLNAYVDCMLGKDDATTNHVDNLDDQRRRKDAVATYRAASKQFFASLNLPELFLSGPNDFKWSSWQSDSSPSDENSGTVGGEGENWFPDLNIKIVKEIISSGGAFSGITTEDTSVGYLTPREWHNEIRSLVSKHKERQNGLCGDGEGGKKDTDEDVVDTVLIDVRNHKECQIGTFAPGISIDPQTKTFAQFPKWVKDNSSQVVQTATPDGTSSASSLSAPVQTTPSLLNNKRILMYCTGGIRCEKASAYIRQMVGPQNKGIFHLKGGIHKYLEEFGGHDALNGDGSSGGKEEKSDGDECLFVGKNFVFDRRGALPTAGHGLNEESTNDPSSSQVKVIGKCQYCSDPYDTFHPGNVCTVCREPILVCKKCQIDLCRRQGRQRFLSKNNSGDVQDDGKAKSDFRTEYHCVDHFHLKTCYFTSLTGFTVAELEKQKVQLQSHSKELEGIGKKGKQRRRTLRKQMDKIETTVKQKLSNDKCDGTYLEPAMQCRHCGSSACLSDCWGFHGGNTRMVNKHKKNGGTNDGNDVVPEKHKQRSRLPSNQRPAKRLKRQNDISEIQSLGLSNPPSRHRNVATGLRVPPPVVRVLRSGVKGRWCGQTVKWVLNNDFGESFKNLTQEGRDERLEQLIAVGLVRVNGQPVKKSDVVLRNMDTIERIVHWHEPPICVPARISLTKHALDESTLPSNSEVTVSPFLYCIDKPSTVPIYPAGPFYANSLLLMVEAQEKLPPKTLIPLHRIDRATSGVLLCANMSSVARVVQGRMISSKKGENDPPIRKLYLAQVKGRFPAKSCENLSIPEDRGSLASIAWCGDESNVIEVDAPIAVQMEANNNKPRDGKDDEYSLNTMMQRSIRSDGKHSVSRFKFISYDATTGRSLVSCAPITGRGHQLRVHLQLIGFPIHNDVEYGGAANAEGTKGRENLSAQSMLEVTATTSEFRHEESVTAQEVTSAIQLCRCCSGGLDGINACFNSAQLLGCGHAIDLHAYKYRISFEQNRPTIRKNVTPLCLGGEETTTMEFSTELPPWASSFVGVALSRFSWLN